GFLPWCVSTGATGPRKIRQEGKPRPGLIPGTVGRVMPRRRAGGGRSAGKSAGAGGGARGGAGAGGRVPPVDSFPGCCGCERAAWRTVVYFAAEAVLS